MNDNQIDDLKQFITATVSQSEQRLGERIDNVEQTLTKRIDDLEHKMEEGFAGVSEAIEGINQHQDEQDARLTDLESAKA
jgi:tetrahydromethanopterin S-methyltransferase subunit G